jgi:hypothetical protein
MAAGVFLSKNKTAIMTLWKLNVHFEVGRGFSDYLDVDSH